MKAPTGSNAQNWEFVVVKDRAVKAKLARLNRMAWAGLRRHRALDGAPRRATTRCCASSTPCSGRPTTSRRSRCIVVACLNTWIPPWPSIASGSLYGSIYPSVQNLLLAARAAGLGAALITLPLWSKTLARWALGLPWNVTPVAVVPMGWPTGRYGPTTRKPVEEVVSLDRYGNRAFLNR